MFLDSSAASRPPRRGCGCLPLVLLALGLALGLVAGAILPPSWRGALTSYLPPSAFRLPPSATPTPAPPSPPPPTPTPTPAPTPTPLPKVPVIPPKALNTARLFNGIQLRATFDAEPGRQAALERETPASYALDLHFGIKVPVAARAADELTRSAPTLLTTFPKLPALLEKAEISRFYFGLYQNKTELLRQNLPRLDALLSRDTFYDTDTILELQDPDSHRRALLIQSDMDVDTDGSDADRLLDIDTSDASFQPLTSYRWPRRTAVVNPLLTTARDRLARLEAESRTPGPARRGLTASIDSLRSEVYQLEHYSSLIARTDPYIVLPGFMTRQTGHPYQPKLGDYAVVLANDKLYPAIFGDIGPGDRTGEASLRLAQAIDPRANADHSPVNDLKITYLVFPGSADAPAVPPDLGKIRARCQALLNEIGGSKLDLFDWPNLIPPPPTPPPAPALTPSPAPTVISASPTPMSTPKPAAAVIPKPLTPSPSIPPAPTTPPAASPTIAPAPKA